MAFSHDFVAASASNEDVLGEADVVVEDGAPSEPDAQPIVETRTTRTDTHPETKRTGTMRPILLRIARLAGVICAQLAFVGFELTA